MATKRTREDDDEMVVEQPPAKKQNNIDTELEELYEIIGKLLVLDESEIKHVIDYDSDTIITGIYGFPSGARSVFKFGLLKSAFLADIIQFV